MAPMVMPINPVVAIAVAVGGVIPKTLSSSRTGITVPRTTRSKPSSSTAAQHSGSTQPRLVRSIAMASLSGQGRSYVVLGQHFRGRGRTREHLQLGDLPAQVEIGRVGEPVQHRGHPPGEVLRPPD